MVSSCATRSAVLAATVVTFARQISALHSAIVPRNRVIRIGAIKANSTATVPSRACKIDRRASFLTAAASERLVAEGGGRGHEALPVGNVREKRPQQRRN